MVQRRWWNTMEMPKTSLELKLLVTLSEAFVVYEDLSTNFAWNYSPNQNEIIYLSQAFTENMMSTYHQLRAKGLFMICKSFFLHFLTFCVSTMTIKYAKSVRNVQFIFLWMKKTWNWFSCVWTINSFFLQNANYNASESSSYRKFAYKSNDWNLRITNNLNVRIFAVSLTSSDWGSI